jgi:hypothetical protein
MKVPTENDYEELDRNIEFIQNGLQRSEQLTTNMVGFRLCPSLFSIPFSFAYLYQVAILDSFSVRLTNLEATMIPIHRLMQEWKFAHESMF